MGWRVLFSERCQHLVDGRIPDVDQHVRVRESLHRVTSLITLLNLGQCPIHDLPSVVLLQNFLVSDGRDTVIIVFKPACLPIWLDKSKIVPAVQVAGVH